MYCLILGAVLAVPVERLDVGMLEPVQAVWMHAEGNKIILETDTENVGIGYNVDEALGELEKYCKGIIYLDTAEFLLVSQNALNQIPALQNYLKGSVKVCLWEGKGTVTDAKKYMSAHKIGYKLKDWDKGVKLPVLPV